MNVRDFFVENKKEINSLSKSKLPIKKSIEKELLSKPYSTYTEYYSLIQLWRKKIIERVFAVRLNRKHKPEIQEVIRRIEGNGLIAIRNMYFANLNGYKTVWNDSNPSPYRFNKATEFNKWETGYINYYNVWIKGYLFPMGDLSSLDPSLKYCAWKKQPIIDWITTYRKFPEIEMISKLGMNRLIYNARVLKLIKTKSFRKYLCWCGGDDGTTGKDVLYGYKKNLKIDAIYNIREYERIANIIVKTYPIIEKEPLLKYIERYHLENKFTLSPYSYIDMIKAEMYLKLDLTLEKNLFPHNFKYWHDYYTSLYQESLNKEIDEKIMKQAHKYQKLSKEINGLKLLIPTKTSEFIDEGNALKHCVGRMGYNTKMADGESLIIFVRKIEDIVKPFVTMEFDPKSKKIIQLYAYDNTVPEEGIRNIIYNEWLPKIKKLKFA